MIGRNRMDTADESARASDEVESPPELSLDEIYHLLQTKRRRDVIRYVRDGEEPVRLRELAEQVAAWEQGTSVESLSSNERQRVYISLYQSHLPKLDNHGIINYDKDRGVVEATPQTAQFDSYLDPAREPAPSDQWPQRYAATIALCTLLVGTTAAGLVPISGLITTGIVLVAMSIVTGAHAWSTGWLHA
ncbi:DUF7344 domain-containing protein [Natrinema ejinorense]|uniref:DUF7344 domain-containing protein n=1 Tax=Natrinema ejinorense TaxID=373386 RepID=A0A2A5QSI9_9EURY|nr:hypothetical protein [Natrinema ejinorense]PCR89733.1 hypothetical protein CP557_03800 [Natrinema ejinorense]